MRSFLIGAAFLIGGCAAPPAPADHPTVYLPRLDRWLAGCWETTNHLERAPWMYMSSSSDAHQTALNPPGLAPIEHEKPVGAGSLTITFFPLHLPHACKPVDPERTGLLFGHGYLLSTLATADGGSLRVIRDYSVRAYAEGVVVLEIDGHHQYRLMVGPGERELVLDPGGRPFEDEPTLRLSLRSRLPSLAHAGLDEAVPQPEGVERARP